MNTIHTPIVNADGSPGLHSHSWPSLDAGVEDIHLIHPRSAIVACPFLDDGENSNKLIVTPYHDLLPKIFTEVLKTKDCLWIKPGDVVWFKAHHATPYTLADHRVVWAIDERACYAILEGW